MCGLVGSHERAGQSIGDGSAAADLDAESDRKVHWQAGDSRGVAEQRVERLKVIAEWLFGIFEPGEDSGVALVQYAFR